MAAKRTIKISANWFRGGHFDVEIPDSAERKLRRLASPRNRSRSPYVSISGNNVVIKGMFDKRMAVRDVHRYNVKTGVVLKCPQDMHPSIKRNLPTVVFLLESPHKDEYSKSNDEYNPIAPAMGTIIGTTGRNLDDGLGYVLSQVRSGVADGSRIIISNPVQFQASLHMILQDKLNTSVRNAVWTALWQHQGRHIKNCFASRMENYNPYLVINACTGGQDDNNGLNKQVTRFLKEEKICREIYEINHPSSWSIPNLWGIYVGND